MRIVIVASVAALVACGSHGSTGAPAPDGGLSPPLPTDVVGTYHLTCHAASGDVDTPVDLSQPQVVIRAWVPDGSPGGHRLVTGTGSADGSFVLHDVPVGATYLLQVATVAPIQGSASYSVTDQREIDLRGTYSTRCSPRPVRSSAAIPVTLDLTNFTPFQSGDRLELSSSSLGITVPVTVGVTGSTLLQASVTWPQGYPLVDAAAGDDLVLVHTRSFQRTDPQPNGSAETRILDWFDATRTTMQSGTPVALTGAFKALTPSRSGTLTIDDAGLQAGYDLTSADLSFQVYVIAQPRADLGIGVFTPAAVWQWFSNGHPPRTGTTTIPYSYADPFPDSWTRTLTIFDDRFRDMRLSSNPAGIIGIGATNQQRAVYTGSIVATHALQPPAGITVAGVDFARGGAVAFDGQSPVVVRWNPVPGAQRYRFTLGKATAAATSSTDTFITTADTSVTVPPALIETGTLYQLLVEAFQTAADDQGGQMAGTVLASVGVPSARFRFLPSCGDGVVQTGEDCDTRGDSASCNADCTFATCGDGVVNAAAGEPCDTVEASDTCTADCKLP